MTLKSSALKLRDVVRHRGVSKCPGCGHDTRETFCEACGYDLVEEARDKVMHRPLG